MPPQVPGVGARTNVPTNRTVERTADTTAPTTGAPATTTPPQPNTGWGPKPAVAGAAWTPQAGTPASAFQFGLEGFTPGAKVEVKDGKYKGHGFGGNAVVNQFDPKKMDLDVNASAMMGLVKVKVKLQWEMDDAGGVKFFGGRTDKDAEPGQQRVMKDLTVKSQTPTSTVFELPMEKEINGKKQTVMQDVLVEKVKKGNKDALHIKYDAYEMTLVPK